MHTALCSFDDRASAESAVHRLVLAGFDRRDVHLQHRESAETGATAPGHHSGTDRWDEMEREVAVDPDVVAKLGRFFTSLFGAADNSQASSYAEVVERGSFVVVVDADDEPSATRAQAVMRELQGGTVNVVHRPTQRPLRDIVGSRQGVLPMESSPVVERAELGEETMRESSIEVERAMASDRLDPKRSSEPRDDASLAPGLRYAADKDKPNN